MYIFETHRCFINDRLIKTVDSFTKKQIIMTDDETIDYIIDHCTEWLNHPVTICKRNV